jgi:hypothetical protein
MQADQMAFGIGDNVALVVHAGIARTAGRFRPGSRPSPRLLAGLWVPQLAGK